MPITVTFSKDRFLTEDSDPARNLYGNYRFGTSRGKRVELSALETFHLLEKGKITIIDGRNNPMDEERVLRRIKEKDFWTRYKVYSDLRGRGYIVKTALKFGAEFRVYDKGVKPGDDHAKWIVYPVKETDALTWFEFSAKNRVAHSTKKRLLIGIVDAEDDVTYYEIRWVRP